MGDDDVSKDYQFENNEDCLDHHIHIDGLEKEDNKANPEHAFGEKETNKSREELLHENIPNEFVPKIDMEFDTEKDAYDFYNKYAAYVGFSVKKHNGHYKNKQIVDRVFTCSCEGNRKDDKRDDDVKRPRAQTRFNCLAQLRVSARQNGKFRVYKFVSHHSHGLLSPKSTKFLRSHRMLTEIQRRQIDEAESVGIAPKARMALFAKEERGRENVGFIKDDYKNYLRSKRMIEMKLGDTGGVLEYLQRKQDEDPNFSYAIQVDIDDLVTNIFWSMKIDYGHFGDVVCFDTTYRKNKEGRPFALFAGVNHHKQTTIFGAALLYDETTETFEWIFQSFAKAMPREEPLTILTDDDPAMAKALASTWPKTYHRLCVWHMYQNAAKHLSHVFDEYKNFAKDFSSCVYDYDEVDDFINAWQEMLEKYDLQNNEWLKRLYDRKEKWALVYGRHTFCADMSATQRSESMNSKLKEYVSYKYDLLRFFQHFERLLEDRRYEESKASAKAKQSYPFLAYPVEILKHAASFYTPMIFKIFNKELWKAWNCDMNLMSEVENISEFKAISEGKSYAHIVTFNSFDNTIICSCKKFDFVGVLCAHVLKALSFKNVKRVPDCYLLNRWSRDAKVGISNSYLCPSMEDPKVVVARRYKHLFQLFNKLAARAAESEETFNISLEGHKKTLEEIENKLKTMSITEPSDNSIPFEDSADKDCTKKVKGLKLKVKSGKKQSSNRWKSALEKATSKRRYKNKRILSELKEELKAKIAGTSKET